MTSVATHRTSIRLQVVLFIALCATLCATLCVSVSPAAASRSVHVVAPAHLRTVVECDYPTGEHPEGLAVARDGSLYVGMAPTGQLTRVDADGRLTSLGTPAFPAGAGYLLGLALDSRDRVYGAVVRFDGAPSGVWRYDRRSAKWELFAATDPAGFPNGLAFTSDGTLLVSDMTLGVIWSVDHAGRATRWLQDQALEGGANGAGVNGLAIDRDGDVWFTNTDQASVGRIAVDRYGEPAGRVTIVAHDPLLASADGLALDADGNAWVAASYGSDRLLRVSPRGQVRLIADASAGLDYTASVAFGRTARTRHSVYVTNSGDDFTHPSVMAMRTGTSGLALHYPSSAELL
jgi:sugar lactone lactonase YvrE